MANEVDICSETFGQHAFDEAAAREPVMRDLDRATDPGRLMNHRNLGEGKTRRLDDLGVPLLVIERDWDQILEAIADHTEARVGEDAAHAIRTAIGSN